MGCSSSKDTPKTETPIKDAPASVVMAQPHSESAAAAGAPHPHHHAHGAHHPHVLVHGHHRPALRPIVLSGPSGAGKSTVLKLLMQEFPGIFGFSVSHTTRKPRPGETNGVEYHFTTREEMLALIEQGEFVETAEFSGNLYGTSKQAVLSVAQQHKICILDIEKKGCENIRKTSLNAKFIQIRPPSIGTLEERLRSRNTETDDSLRRRLEEAVEALEYGEQPGKFDHVIVNHTVEETYTQLKATLAEDIALAAQLRASSQ